MGGAESVSIDFDYLVDDEHTLEYRIIHCNSDWQQDDLFELDYLDGFLPVRVTDVKPSYNTYVGYWHYCVRFPNEEIRLKASGNYEVRFYDQDEAQTEPVAVARFSVSEQMAFVGGTVSPNTDIDFMAGHQQLTLECTWSESRLPYLNPTANMWHVVTQNHQASTHREVKSPVRYVTGKAWYEHDRQLIFDAGNTWRRFEFIYQTGQTFGVHSVDFHDPYYYVMLNVDGSREGLPYRYDQDQHGRFKVRARNVDDIDTEADYFIAQFRLSPDNLGLYANPHKKIVLQGDFTEGLPVEDYTLKLDPETGLYTCEVLLKQGHYNYRYSVGEGNCHETQNEYEVYTWYRGPQDRYDRLLGVAVIR